MGKHQSHTLLSIIVPVYNSGEHLDECLSSIVPQIEAYNGRVELIIIDDGSVDKSGAIIAQYSKTKGVISKRVNGLTISDVRNLGLDMARGEYIGFVDSDDYVVDDYVERILNMVNKKYDLLVFRYRSFKDNGGSSKIVGFHWRIAGNPIIINDSIAQQYQLMWGLTPFVWDKIFSSAVIKMNDLRFPDGSNYAEDCSFVMEYVNCCSRVKLLDAALYNYRNNSSGSITNSVSRNWQDIYKSVGHLVDYYKRQGTFLSYEYAICMLTCGLYQRRMAFIKKCKRVDRAVVDRFIDMSIDFMDDNFNNWRGRFNRWYKNLNYLTTKSQAKLYVRTYKLDAIKRKLVKLKRILKSNRSHYAFYSKHYAIRQDCVVAISFGGAICNDSPYYLAKSLSNLYELKTYLVCNNQFTQKQICDRDNWRTMPMMCSTTTKQYPKLLATAKYIICNDSLPAWFIKRPGQVLINTWHGTPLKTLGKDMHSDIGRYLGYVQTKFMMADYLLFPNEFTKDKMEDSYFLRGLYGGKMILSGYPRNSVLFDCTAANKWRQYYGVAKKRIFAYMPTWRANALDAYGRDREIEIIADHLQRLDELLDDDIIIYTKLHHLVSSAKIDFRQFKHIRAFDGMLDSYQFLNMADCLITDYSSVMFDFASSGRDVILFTYDYAEYTNERGVYIDVLDLPFPKVDDIDHLARTINQYRPRRYDNLPSQLQQYCQYDSIDNSDNLASAIFNQDDSSVLRIDSPNYRASANRVVFAGTDVAELEKTIDNLTERDILVFYKPQLSGDIETTVYRLMDKIPHLIVVPGWSPMTLFDYLAVVFYRRTGFGKCAARRYYRREISRILPNISTSSFVNNSNNKRFNDITELFKKGV